MTLITHIWTKNINVIAGDRRLTNKNLTNPIVSENTRKIYANKNSFFSYHGDYDINNEMTMTDLAGDFYSENSNKSVVDIADNLNRILIENRNKPLKTGFIIGGQFDTNQSAYFNENKIIYDHKNYEIGSRLNSESEQQRIKLMELLDNSINEVTSNSYKSWNKYDEYSNQDFLDIFNLFYNKVHKDPEANPSNGIGSEFDLGIIRNGKYEWIKLL
jgi:hypothetical protein|tara:strand:+ start:68 stop:715 length:648 start_codon:yes stop_codon:yes gene_type:complete